MTFSRSTPRKTASAVALVLTTFATLPAGAASVDFQGLTIEVVGKGRPVLMIPGLNSSADTWRETCGALQADRVQCHLVQLPGFAGAPAVQTDAFLVGMRDRLLAYIDAQKLKRPVVMGHSLGGVVALQMAIARPDAAERLVIVDALPYWMAATNPKATVETMAPMVKQMEAGMRGADDAAFKAQGAAAVRNMTHDAARTETLKQWGAASDRATTTQAMVEMMSTDLRGEVARIKVPTLVLGAWAAYKPHGSTLESTRGIFQAQYAGLKDVRIEMSQGGYHFLMWDDPQWLQAQVRSFIAPPAAG